MTVNGTDLSGRPFGYVYPNLPVSGHPGKEPGLSATQCHAACRDCKVACFLSLSHVSSFATLFSIALVGFTKFLLLRKFPALDNWEQKHELPHRLVSTLIYILSFMSSAASPFPPFLSGYFKPMIGLVLFIKQDSSVLFLQIRACYRLKVCVPPDSQPEVLTPTAMVLEGRQCEPGRALLPWTESAGTLISAFPASRRGRR